MAHVEAARTGGTAAGQAHAAQPRGGHAAAPLAPGAGTLQALAENSQQALQLKSWHAMANHGAQAQAVVQLQAAPQAVIQLGKKKEKWRNAAIDGELKSASGHLTVGHTAETADSGHHKLAKSKLKKLYPSLTDGDKTTLGVKGEKDLLSLRSNITLGPNSSLRSEDPGDGFDANFDAGGAMTPRSAHLARADRALDGGEFKDTHVREGVESGTRWGAVAGGLAGLANWALPPVAALLGIAAAPVVAGAGLLAAGAMTGALGGSLVGYYRQRKNDQRKQRAVDEIAKAEKAHPPGNVLDKDLSMWQQDHKKKFSKRK